MTVWDFISFLDSQCLDRIDSLLTLQNKHLRKTSQSCGKLWMPLSPAGRIIPKRQSYCFCTQNSQIPDQQKLRSVLDLDFEDQAGIPYYAGFPPVPAARSHFHSEE